ncbi:Aspartic peptidase A1 family protein [Dioscorea alata]|uniref:Aspartic peptidase A1 family protein n=1 Tax=Dioscorea alata TaxID=55571 RepID=A0ACB7UNE8_DIOAL|nr:Aspartic peptidase A1 family protein [Dioscorea alata]
MIITVFGGNIEIITAKNLGFQMAIVEKLYQTPAFSNVSLMANFHAGAQEQLKSGFSGRVEHIHTTYVVTMSIGIPGTPVSLSIDTGSDATWLQCKPCTNCFKKRDPPFDPKESFTFKYTMCENEHCKIFANRLSPACDDHQRCQFSIKYGDNSTVSCNMASDFFQLEGLYVNRKAFNHPLYFGCAFSAIGVFHEGEDGMLGLGQGPFSIISQLNISKFSHCLQPPGTGETSYILFGDEARLDGQAAPLIRNKVFPSQYFVNFHSIIVVYNRSEIKLNVPSDLLAMDKNGRGGLMLDFGTTLTRIPKVAYHELCRVLLIQASLANITAKFHRGKLLRFCLDASLKDLKDISLIFRLDSVDIKLTGRQLFNRMIFPDTVTQELQELECLTISVSSNNMRESIFGAYAQANNNIGYDLENWIVTFNNMQC